MIFDTIYVFLRIITEGFIKLFYNPSCDICTGSNGHCDECKYNTYPGCSGTKNLFCKDYDKVYRK